MLDFFFTARFLINEWAFPLLDQIWSVGFFLYFLVLFIKKQLSINTKILLFFSLVSLYLLLFMPFSPSHIIFWRQYYLFAFGFLGFIIGASLDSQKIVRSLIFSAFLVSLVSFYAFYIGKTHVLSYLRNSGVDNPFAKYFLHQNRAFFPFLLPNSLGSFMSLAFILNLGVTYKDKEKSWRIILGATFLLLVILSRSLGSLICLAVVIGIYLFRKRNSKMKLALFLFIAASVLLAIFFIRQDSVYIARPSFSFWQRLRFWHKALVIIKQHPLRGVGVGGYYLYTGVMYCHNVFLQMWLDYGILGFLGLGLLISHIIFRSIKAVVKNPQNNIILAVALANLFFVFHNLVDIDFYIFQLSFVWFVVLGIMDTVIYESLYRSN